MSHSFWIAAWLLCSWMSICPVQVPPSKDKKAKTTPPVSSQSKGDDTAKANSLTDGFQEGDVWEGSELILSDKKGRETSDAILTITKRDKKTFEATYESRGGKDKLELKGMLLDKGMIRWQYTKILKGHTSSRNIIGDVLVQGVVTKDTMKVEFKWPYIGSTPRTSYMRHGTIQLKLNPEKAKDNEKDKAKDKDKV